MLLTALVEKWLDTPQTDHKFRDYYFLAIALLVLLVCNLFFLYYNIAVVPFAYMRNVMVVSTILTVVGLLLLHRARSPFLAALITQSVMTLASLLLIFEEGNSEFSLAFIYLTPALSMFILGYRIGSVFSITNLAVIVYFCLQNMDSWGDVPFDSISFIHMVIVYLFLFLVAYFYDSTRRKTLLALEESNTKLRNLATIDLLTQLPNRRYLDDCLHSKEESWVALIDVDDFKQINDTYGHDSGDQVLFELARVFERVLIEKDVVGRWGGEEFVILFSEHDRSNIESRLAQLVTLVSKADLGIERQVTISIGAALHQPQEHKKAILKADAALYKAKQLGKNRFFIAE
ncbi:GGDEF domain-containing protein [Vibrio aquaticus]|uniref:diguanylate cyclase n=1 Tax=Vibrio aquaticus TaxID=2496559 RepID=A0A3S0Q106_9VIBR|nr:GGDEF domain-containing protein [Vibrio aquaticus]RTZ15263.1 GGDEF domain-containing protein [Vibrio aquaticus]